MEVWKDIENYEGLYQVSSLGRVKSLDRVVITSNKKKVRYKGRFLKQSKSNNGYLFVALSNKKISIKNTHVLVAESFLGHVSKGWSLVVNHIDFDKTNNRADNLEVVTQRNNANRKHLKSSSEYTGVSWYKRDGKWVSNIVINRKLKHLGYFNNELEASNAYQKALKEII